uniref:C3H1-type domain-containing protein n=1 Tax=Parascaris univalens TaxID=6257 RepID=A0A915BYA8_PARUN
MNIGELHGLGDSTSHLASSNHISPFPFENECCVAYVRRTAFSLEHISGRRLNTAHNCCRVLLQLTLLLSISLHLDP